MSAEDKRHPLSAKQHPDAAAYFLRPLKHEEFSWPIVRFFRWTLTLFRSWNYKRANQRNKLIGE